MAFRYGLVQSDVVGGGIPMTASRQKRDGKTTDFSPGRIFQAGQFPNFKLDHLLQIGDGQSLGEGHLQ